MTKIYNQPHHRLAERKELKCLLKSGDSALCLAPRRIGKTWLLDRIAEDLISENWRCFRVDVQGARNEGEFLRELIKSIESEHELSQRLTNHVLSRVQQILGGKVGDNLAQTVGKLEHRDFLVTLIEGLQKEGQPTLILIDEIALFVLQEAGKDPEAIKNLLYFLRSFQKSCPNIRWFFTGSVGLDAVSRRFGIEDALSGLKPFALEAFTSQQAYSFICERQLERGFPKPECAPGAFELLTKELGWLSPYHLGLVVDQLVLDAGETLIDAPKIKAAFAALLAPSQRLHFAGWREYVDKNFPPEDVKPLKNILDFLCQKPEGAKFSTLRAHLATGAMQPTERNVKNWLGALEADSILMSEDDNWRFTSGLLRNYWSQYESEIDAETGVTA